MHVTMCSSCSKLLSVIAVLLCGGWPVATRLTNLDVFLSKFNELYDGGTDINTTVASEPFTLDTDETAYRDYFPGKYEEAERYDSIESQDSAERHDSAGKYEGIGRRGSSGLNGKAGPPKPIVALAHSKQPDDTPCLSVEGLWLSSNLETVFEVTTTAIASRLDLRAVGSDWTGAVEVLFRNSGGPLSAVISQPDTGTVATFVGYCRTDNGVDSITGMCSYINA